MKIAQKIINFSNSIINLIIITFLIIAILFSGYAIVDAYAVYDNANLSNVILDLKPDDNNNSSIPKLQELNPDICGWITINNTSIDYPVVIGVDNSVYLNKDYKKEYSSTGSIFMDYRNDRNFGDDYTILYGHNMRSSQMFADIKKFEDKKFFDENEFGVLYTADAKYTIDIFCCKKVSAFSEETYNLRAYRNDSNRDVISFFSKNVINKRDLNIDVDQDKLLLLSTCDIASENDRVVLVTKLSKVSDDTQTIN